MEEDKGRVCVTGGTGFIGSWIIKTLLEHDYSVNTTIRSHPSDHKKDVSFLTSLPKAPQRLQILKADLENPESFKEAIEGCIGVFHVASPIDFEVREDEEIVTKRAINGALGILKACLASKTVKRVVYTSSSSAISFKGKDDYDDDDDDDNEAILDESFWTDVEYLRASKPFGWSYAVSKTLTEKAMLEFGEENGLDVVSLNPTSVVGPFICPKLPGSVYHSLYLSHGENDQFSIIEAPMVHVDDVARAHIFLLEHPNPKGRYNCSSCLTNFERIVEFISTKYPEIQTPTIDSLKKNGWKLPDLSSKKLIDAGFEFKYGFEKMIDETIQCCKEKGYL